VLGQCDALILDIGDPLMSDAAARIELNVDLVFGFADLHAAADPGGGNREPIGVQRDVALGIDRALLDPVDFRNPDRQWL
jgi:hypothetical protein